MRETSRAAVDDRGSHATAPSLSSPFSPSAKMQAKTREWCIDEFLWTPCSRSATPRATLLDSQDGACEPTIMAGSVGAWKVRHERFRCFSGLLVLFPRVCSQGSLAVV